jgi:peptidoglycan-associated lipoprotein
MDRPYWQNNTIDQEGLMRGRRHTVTAVGIAVLGMLMTVGCSGHSVRYGANSEGEGESAIQENSAATGGVNAGAGGGYRADGQSGYPGGAVNGNTPFGHDASSQAADGTSTVGVTGQALSADASGGNSAGSSNFSGTDYGHDYSGVPGSGPNKGGVDGFGQGSASGTNPAPEAWANAYLRGGDGSQDFYGDPSGHRGSGGANSVNPKTWADTYAQENGGPSPEYVNPDMSIAQVKESPRSGYDPERTGMNGTTGFRGPDGKLQDIYFAFDSWAITPEGARDLERGAQWLRENPSEVLTIEGHCDQRGTQDYNLVLGKKRAEAAREYLEKLGIDSQRIKVVSYGKERPFCQNESEDCFQTNRRSHMVIQYN